MNRSSLGELLKKTQTNIGKKFSIVSMYMNLNINPYFSIWNIYSYMYFVYVYMCMNIYAFFPQILPSMNFWISK